MRRLVEREFKAMARRVKRLKVVGLLLKDIVLEALEHY